MSFTTHDAQIRDDNCEDCVDPCEDQKAGRIDVNDPCAACPRRKWGAWGNCQSTSGPLAVPAPNLSIPVGLGDWVDGWAKPIGRWIDHQTKRLSKRYRTHLAGCSACSRRRYWLNRLVPNVRTWRGWLKLLRRA
jgi:hypothetical protein